MDDQKRMEEYILKTMDENNIGQKDWINGMMKAAPVSCSFDERSITWSFPLQEWQSNRAGFLQGGIIAQAFDMVVSAVARFYAKTTFIPTVSMDIKFLKAVKMDDTIIVTARALSVGRTISHFILTAESKNTGNIVASGAAIYMSIDGPEKGKPRIESNVLKNIINNSDRF